MAAVERNRILVERALPQDGRDRRQGASDKKDIPRSVTVNLAESPLGWLLARGLVTERQFAAGEQLRGDWERAQMEPSVTMKWDAPPAAPGPRAVPQPVDPTTAQLAAKSRFDAAVEAVGPGLGDILWRIVCAGEGMREAERALGWPARAGRLVLGLALDRLAAFYRLG